MPESTSTTSEAAADPSSAPFVLDFLYHDSRRIGSFLAQFEGEGHLQGFTQTKNATRGKNETTKFGGKANAGFAAGELGHDTQTVVTSVEGYARVFDPYWANARAFLDYVSDRDLLSRDIRSASIGQFVLAKGHLSVLDLAMLKEAWRLKSIQRKIFERDGKRVSQMTAAEKQADKAQRENNEMMLEMMQVLPHSIHATILGGEENAAFLAWATLREEYLTQPASEITLAHGSVMPGQWSVVGILTATPEFVIPGLDAAFDDDAVGTMSSMVGQMSQLLAPIVRVVLGRPAAAYAITPLLLFREVA